MRTYGEYLLKGEVLYEVFNLSYPPGNSFNDFIDEQLTTVHFSKFDNVISIIQTLGEHAKIGKTIY
jgi:hypothetical protein